MCDCDCHDEPREIKKAAPAEGTREGKRCAGESCECSCHQKSAPMDHLDYTVDQWKCAFDQALHEVRVDLLKGKIKESMGKTADATAKAVLDAMIKEWKEFMKREAEKAAEKTPDPDEDLKAAIQQAWKKGPQ